MRATLPVICCPDGLSRVLVLGLFVRVFGSGKKLLFLDRWGGAVFMKDSG